MSNNKKNNAVEREAPPINEHVPPRVPPVDALGKPIDPPNPQAEPELHTTFKDTDTDAMIWQSDFVPMAEYAGRQVTIDIYIEGNRVHHMYYIDRVDTDTKTVYMTLNKVYLNDNPQFPIS
jgi:hypothetical protein